MRKGFSRLMATVLTIIFTMNVSPLSLLASALAVNTNEDTTNEHQDSLYDPDVLLYTEPAGLSGLGSVGMGTAGVS